MLECLDSKVQIVVDIFVVLFFFQRSVALPVCIIIAIATALI